MSQPSKDQGADATRGPDTLDDVLVLAGLPPRKLRRFHAVMKDYGYRTWPVGGTDGGAAASGDQGAAPADLHARLLDVLDQSLQRNGVVDRDWIVSAFGAELPSTAELLRTAAPASGRGAAVEAEGVPGAAPIKSESQANPACLEPQEAMRVLLAANKAVPRGAAQPPGVLRGAMTHTGAQLLNALRELGFGLAPLSPKETDTDG